MRDFKNKHFLNGVKAGLASAAILYGSVYCARAKPVVYSWPEEGIACSKSGDDVSCQFEKSSPLGYGTFKGGYIEERNGIINAGYTDQAGKKQKFETVSQDKLKGLRAACDDISRKTECDDVSLKYTSKENLAVTMKYCKKFLIRPVFRTELPQAAKRYIGKNEGCVELGNIYHCYGFSHSPPSFFEGTKEELKSTEIVEFDEKANMFSIRIDIVSPENAAVKKAGGAWTGDFESLIAHINEKVKERPGEYYYFVSKDSGGAKELAMNWRLYFDPYEGVISDKNLVK